MSKQPSRSATERNGCVCCSAPDWWLFVGDQAMGNMLCEYHRAKMSEQIRANWRVNVLLLGGALGTCALAAVAFH